MGGRWLGLQPGVRRISDAVPFLPCTATVNGAAGHKRGEVAETPPLARTQGRTVGCILIFNFVGPFLKCFLRVLRPYNGEDQNVESQAVRLLTRQSRLGVYTLFRRHHRATCRETWKACGLTPEPLARKAGNSTEMTGFTCEEILGLQWTASKGSDPRTAPQS